MREQLKSYLELKKYHNTTTNPKHLFKKFPLLINEINEKDNLNFSGKLYCYLNEKEYPICSICGAPHKFISFKKGFLKNCGKNCNKDNIILEDNIYRIDHDRIKICDKHNRYTTVNQFQTLKKYNVEHLCEICSLEKRSIGLYDKNTVNNSKKTILELTKNRKMINLEIIKNHFPELYSYVSDIRNINPNSFINKLNFFLYEYDLKCKEKGCDNIVSFDKSHKPKEICESCQRKKSRTEYTKQYSKEYWITFIDNFFNNKIDLSAITINNKDIKIKNYCEHGDLSITKNRIKKIKNDEIFSLCTDCNKDFYRENKIKKQTNEIIKTKWDKIKGQSEEKLLYTNPYIWAIIDNQMQSKKVSFSEAKYMLRYDIEKIPKCLDCENAALFSNEKYGYLNHCQEHIYSFKSSKGEAEIQEFLRELNIDFIIHDRKELKGKELDIYIPDRRIGIEFNGLYWHSDINISEKTHHYNKWKLCQDNDIKLITIWEDDWRDKQDLVKSMIKNQLGLNENKIYARKCEIKLIDSDITKIFLEKNHIQGNCQSSIRLGLFLKEELVSLMTFGKKRMVLKSKSNNNSEYELLRFCNKKNTTIIGGASKLFSYFIKHFNPNSVVSYANLDISNGKLYEILGFENKNHTGINYWWALDRRYHRSNFMKHKLVTEGADPNKTEDEIMRENGYMKIYGIGNLKFVWYIS